MGTQCVSFHPSTGSGRTGFAMAAGLNGGGREDRIWAHNVCVIANSEKSGIIKTGFQEGEK